MQELMVYRIMVFVSLMVLNTCIWFLLKPVRKLFRLIIIILIVIIIGKMCLFADKNKVIHGFDEKVRTVITETCKRD